MHLLRNILLASCLLIAQADAYAQIITTVAGNGSVGYTGNGGLATAAGIGFPGFITFDNFGNYYIEELNNTIRKVSVIGIIGTIAGNGTSGGGGDGGPATAAQFNFTGGGGIAFDKLNNLYVADQANNKIRKINAITGIITTFAGVGTAGFTGDNGSAILAEFNSPVTVAFDKIGNLYVLDGFNYRIRKIDTFGIITTIAGNGSMGYSGDNGPATLAKISTAGGMRIGNHNDLYQADGIRIRKIDLATGIITLIAGNSISGFSGDNGPATDAGFYNTMDVAIDATDNIYVSDRNDNRVRKINNLGIITTSAGNGTGTYLGDNVIATSTSLYSPRGIALDSCGNVYISDNGNHRIRKVTFNPECWPVVIKDVTTESLSLFPTPATDIVHITGIKEAATYILYEMTGRAIIHGALLSKEIEINISNLATGIYLLQVQYKGGEREIRKIVKE